MIAHKLPEMSGYDASRALAACEQLKVDPDTIFPGFTFTLVQVVCHKKEGLPGNLSVASVMDDLARLKDVEFFGGFIGAAKCAHEMAEKD